MRIERLREERTGEWHRVAADVAWEDREAPVQTHAVETRLPFARDLEPSSDAFLIALLPLAQWHGETRIQVEGRVCVRLRDGLAAAMHLFALWYPRCRPLRIEPTRGFAPTVPRREPRAACFLSGGIDALSLLRLNRLDYPVSHPSFIRDGILIFGLNSFDASTDGPNPDRLLAFQSHAHRMTSFAENAGLTLMPMRTNIRALYPDFPTWSAVGLAAGIVSTALCMSARIDRVQLGSTGLGLNHPPLGSHPLLDHHYSTEAVEVRQAQSALTRFEKTRIVAEWDEALSVLRSCLYVRIPEAGRINCGECEKCLRTMLALVALGKLDRAPTFPHRDVTASMLGPVLIENQINVVFYTECIEALIARGRDDLVAPLRRKIDAYRRRERRRRVRALVRRVTGL
jgi:hypothetical protein